MAGLDPQSLEGLDLSERIRISRLKAIGGLGYVFLGEVLSMGRPVASCAVKLMHPRPMCSAETLIQDIREQSRFVHPHLMALQHSGLVREGPARDWIFLVWESAEYSLQDLLTKGQTLTPTQVRELLVHTLEALRYLHAQGIVHGEIRPANLLYTQSGWRLSGLEHRGNIGRRLEEVGYTQNHFVFRAPEAQEKSADHSSADLWSLSVVAHAALTGGLPFDEEEARDRSDLLWRILHQDPVYDELNEPFDRLLRHTLIRDPQLRWNAEQALSCLLGKPVPEQISISIPSVAGSIPPDPEVAADLPVIAPPPPQPGASPVFLLLGVGLVLVGLFIGKFLLPPPPRRVQQVLPAERTSLDYQVGTLDDRGRLSTESARAPMLVEDLGNGIALELVEIPQGHFDQGARPDDPHQEPDESPRRRVRIDTFYLSRSEITQQMWTVVSGWPAVQRPLPRTPWRSAEALLPVQGVSWEEAHEFCLRLSQNLGREYRLPTEAEWEYACRGGPVESLFHFGEVLTDQVANFAPIPTLTESIPPGLNRGEAVAVTTYPCASHFGLLQMHGNVKEWCSDFYAPYSSQPQVNPGGPARGVDRVVRGGGYKSPAARCRSSARAHEPPHQAPIDVGFRVAVSEVSLVQGNP